MRDHLDAAADRLAEVKRAMGQGQASYDDAKAAAVALLTLRQQAEIITFGKARTKITAVAIATLLR